MGPQVGSSQRVQEFLGVHIFPRTQNALPFYRGQRGQMVKREATGSQSLIPQQINPLPPNSRAMITTESPLRGKSDSGLYNWRYVYWLFHERPDLGESLCVFIQFPLCRWESDNNIAYSCPPPCHSVTKSSKTLALLRSTRAMGSG